MEEMDCKTVMIKQKGSAMKDFNQLEWFTIQEFAGRTPRYMYHKEQEKPREDEGYPDASTEMRNVHVLARSVYEYSGVQMGEGTEHLLQISADDYYKLYVNGIYIGQGPAPAWPEHYYYNEIDITPYLHDGENTLGVHLYYQGLVNRVWNSGDGRLGLACQILKKVGKEDMANASVIVPQWKYCISQAFSGEVIGYDTQFLENFDSRKWENGWENASFDDSGWRPMVKATWADYCCFPQPTEMVSMYFRKPEILARTQHGLFVDMGEEITGALCIQAKSAQDGGELTVRCGEELMEDHSNRVRFSMRCNCKYEEKWIMGKGRHRMEPYDYKGFRYAEILFGDGIEVTEVQAMVRHYPMDEALCTLETSNQYLDSVFRICKNGVKYGTQEGFLDCPTREKGQYLGDAVVTSRSHVWLTGDTRMLRKCISQFAQTVFVCPGLLAVAPGAYMQEIADFSLLWAEMLLTDYVFTKDREFLRKHYKTAVGIVEYFRKYEREDGLLEEVTDKWNLVDWPENLRDGYEFPADGRKSAPECHNVINALYVGAVKTLEEIEGILGVEGSGRESGRKSWEELRCSFVRAFYCKESGLFRDSTVSSHSALHSNLYPLLFDLCPEGSEGKIADFLEDKGLCCGVMVGYFYLRALARAGRYEAVFRALINESRQGWVNMIREGATSCWEAWGKEQKKNTSLCHPWASGPIPIIIEEIAGFHPDPDKKEGFRFEPHISDGMGKFCLQIPFQGKKYMVRNNELKAIR